MRSGLLWVLGIAAACVPLYLASASKIVDHDVFVMGEVAQMVLEGETLYETAWDNKPPLALMSYALPLSIAPGSYRAVQLSLAALVTLQGVLIWWMLRGEQVWFRVAAAALAILLPLHAYAFVWFSSEDVANLMILPLILGSYRIVSRKDLSPGLCLAVGASLVLGFHARQTVLLFGLLPAVALLGTDRTIRDRAIAILWMMAGASVGLGMIAALIALVADWQGYLQAVFIAPRTYQGHYWGAITSFFFAKDRVPVLLMLVSTVMLVWRGPYRGFFLALAGASAAVILAPMKPFYHYYGQLIPALCLMVPAAIDRLGAPKDVPLALVGVFGLILINVALTCGHMGLIRTEMPSTVSRSNLDPVARAIEEEARPGETLFAAGQNSAYLYFATQVPAANPYFWERFLEEDLLALAPVEPDWVFDAYEEFPPDLLVLDRRRLNASRDPRSGEGRFEQLLSGWIGSGRYENVREVEGYSILRKTRERPEHSTDPPPDTPRRLGG